ncbi:hypothetical protein THAOC_31138 [Thalassiosira oceanica]|uniref:SUI1 domain-containing protein n=1 Tax=Thalassiosira oceanica TaxID=159749 RepID=K0RCC0_THAOC|nr:hypothetical protein THAOC_31138 [Thalassiosira oceanica]|eukprot:EJK49934.1 hypothetical protein THAOC_31138 [Thalassiosira oceanica]
MFQKDGSSIPGGKKDAPLRKSDRRRLRDRALAVLFKSPPPNADDRPPPPAWADRASRLVDDALTSSSGDVLSRRLRLAGGESASLFLRAPSKQQAGVKSRPAPAGGERESSTIEEIRDSYPAEWPYRSSTQPVLLEYEDGDRETHLVPLLPLLAALPPPALVSGSAKSDDEDAEASTGFRIPDVVVHPAVSKYVCRGADLMRSGMRSFPSPEELRRSPGGLVTISVIGNPQPLAVGTVDAALFREHCRPRNGKARQQQPEGGGMTELVGPGTSGVGVRILTCYGDDLCRRAAPRSKAEGEGGAMNPLGGGCYDDGSFGNVGFDGGRYVHPIMETGGGESSDEEDEDKPDGEEADAAGESQAEETSVGATDGMEQLTVVDDAAKEADAPPDDGEAEAEESPDEAEAVDHDAILLAAFYTSLLRMLQSKAQFPVPVSTYYAKHLLSSVPSSGPGLNLKRTRHKKIGPFLAEMERDGVVMLGPSKDGKDKCAFLVGVNRKSRELIQFKREHWNKEDGASAQQDSGKATKMGVVDLFIVPSRIVEGMKLDRDAVSAAGAKAEERRGSGYLTKAECRSLVEVLVDGPLCDALFKVGKKRQQQQQQQVEKYPTSIKRKDLVEKWLDKMDKGHAIVQMPGSKIIHMGRGEPKAVDIEVEFRQGNKRKFLTRVRGMEEYGIDGTVLARDVSHRFACSGSAESDPVGRPALRKGRVEIVFQGHLSEEIVALLVGDEGCVHGGARDGGYNLPKSVVQVSLRKGVPAKKKR